MDSLHFFQKQKSLKKSNDQNKFKILDLCKCFFKFFSCFQNLYQNWLGNYSVMKQFIFVFFPISIILAISLAGLYIVLASLHIFDFKRFGGEKLLKITIPEDLDYNEAFDAILKTYLKSYELVEIKTTGMGSLFRLSYKIELLVKDSEKALIDELRIKNSNLEISLLPYVESNKSL